MKPKNFPNRKRFRQEKVFAKKFGDVSEQELREKYPLFSSKFISLKEERNSLLKTFSSPLKTQTKINRSAQGKRKKD